MITGRRLQEVDALLGPTPAAVAGEHGGAIRHGDGVVRRPDLPVMPPDWLRAAQALVAAYPGTMLETKPHGFVLHHRAVPDQGAALLAALKPLLDGSPDFQIMPARMAWEVKPAGINKGLALRAIMQQPPFAGRLPVFVGDDVTDQDAIAAAADLGGVGLFVPTQFKDAAGVRRWLSAMAHRAEHGP